ncbi:hypothetical protein V498_07489 [Pseudogymnoascus sp. VKM F-4517 (FW-2822)]|nr:hypothetical protein V498_07489 [Pseudogymnoascus sp. VKM F-4517 (FW-2822)]
MLLDEDPATLIHHTIGNFNIQPDKLAVSRINESLSTLQQARDLRLREAENSLKTLPNPQYPPEQPPRNHPIPLRHRALLPYRRARHPKIPHRQVFLHPRNRDGPPEHAARRPQSAATGARAPGRGWWGGGQAERG